MSELPLPAIADQALQAAPITKARGYWATVGRRLVRDNAHVMLA